jgi:hypothetical protein
METTMNTLSVSKHCARMLLAAWNSADLSRLQSALTLAEGVQAGRLAYAEQERIELVHEIASMIRQWMKQQRTGEDLNASLQILRHLAQDVEAISALHIREALLPEMPVFAQN